MDEPCSALDPIATARIEDLMQELKSSYTIVIVTHNMQQAARVSDRTAFFTAEVDSESDQPHRRARRVRPHREDLLEPVRRADRELRHRPVRLTETESAAPAYHQTSSTRSTTEHRRASAAAPVGARPSRGRPQILLDGRPARAPTTSSTTTTRSTTAASTSRRSCYAGLALQAAGGGRPAHAGRRGQDHGRGRALGRPGVNICKAARRLYGHGLDPRLRGLITQMSEQAQQLYARRRRRLRRERRGQGGRPRRHGRPARRAPARAHPGHLREPRRGPHRPAGRRAAGVVARFYERIGDHAVNIGERVRYIVTGWLPEHDGAARYRAPSGRRTPRARPPGSRAEPVAAGRSSPLIVVGGRRSDRDPPVRGAGAAASRRPAAAMQQLAGRSSSAARDAGAGAARS